jgi:hypothetical protein
MDPAGPRRRTEPCDLLRYCTEVARRAHPQPQTAYDHLKMVMEQASITPATPPRDKERWEDESAASHPTTAIKRLFPPVFRECMGIQ